MNTETPIQTHIQTEVSASWRDGRSELSRGARIGGDERVTARLVLQALGLFALLAALTAPVWPEISRITPSDVRGHLPWLSICCAVALLLTVARLVHGRRSPVLRWADLGLRLLVMLVLVRLLLGPPLLTTSAMSLFQLAPQPEHQMALMNVMVRLALLGALIGLAGWTLQGLASLLQETYLDAWNAGRVGRYLLGIALGLCLMAPLALLLGNTAYLGPGLPLGLVLGASLDRHNEKMLF